MAISDTVVAAVLAALIGLIGNILKSIIETRSPTPANDTSHQEQPISRRANWFPFFVIIVASALGALIFTLFATSDKFEPRAYPQPHTQTNRSDEIFDQEVPVGEIYCLIGGTMSLPELDMLLDEDNQGSIVCWIGKQRALAVGIIDDQSLAEIAFQDFVPLEVANFWAQYWAQRRVIGPDGCGTDLCETVAIVLIQPNKDITEFVVVKHT